MLRRFSVLPCLSPVTLMAMVAILVGSAIAAPPEDKKTNSRNSSDTLSGKIVSTRKKGRTTIVSVENDAGEKSEHILSSKTPVQVKGQGDSGFLVPGAVVSTRVQKNKQLLFGKSFTVYLSGSQNRGWKQGEKPEILDVVGEVVQKTEKELTLNMGRSGRGILQLEKGYEVKIIANDPELIQEGAKVELHGKSSRGRFKVSLLEIQLEKPLDSKKYFESKQNPKKRGRNRVTERARGKTKKSGDDKEQGGFPKGPVKSPFSDSDKSKEKSDTGAKK